MKTIMYHYVQEFDHNLPYSRFLNRNSFSKQLEYFSSNYKLINMQDDLLFMLSTATEFDNVTLLTFDDGLKCQYKYVLPLLSQLNIKALFYIPTAPYTDGYSLGVHKIHLMLAKENSEILAERLKRLIMPEMINNESILEYSDSTYTSQLNDANTTWIKRCLNYFVDITYRDNLINKLFSQVFGSINEAELIDHIYMSVDDIRELVQAGMIIGSHANSHRSLPQLSISDAIDEIDTSFDFLETITPLGSCRSFCYPYGRSNSTIEELLTLRNVDFSFNVESRDVVARDYLQRPQALPRHNCNEFEFGKVDPI